MLSSLKDVTEMQETELKKFMDELMAEYRERNGGVLITEIANGYQMITNTAYAPFLKNSGPRAPLQNFQHQLLRHSQ